MFKKLYEVLTKITEKFLISTFVIVLAFSVLLTLALFAFLFVFAPIERISQNKKEQAKIERLTEEFPITTTTEFSHIITKVAEVDEVCIDSYSQKTVKKENKVYFWIKTKEETYVDSSRRRGEDFPNSYEHRFKKDSLPNYCETERLKIPASSIKPDDTLDLKGECFRTESALKILDGLYPKQQREFEEEIIFDFDSYLGTSDEKYEMQFKRIYPASCQIKVLSVSDCIKSHQLTPSKYHLSGYAEGEVLTIRSKKTERFFDHYQCDHPQHEEFLIEAKRKAGLN